MHFDWQLIHSLGEEFALWTTVAINSWLLTTVFAFAVARLRSRNEATIAQLMRSAQWGYLTVFTAANLIGFSVCLGIILSWSSSVLLKTTIAIGLTTAVVFWEWLGIFAWTLRRRRRRH